VIVVVILRKKVGEDVWVVVFEWGSISIRVAIIGNWFSGGKGTLWKVAFLCTDSFVTSDSRGAEDTTQFLLTGRGIDTEEGGDANEESG
jgi:hypothetical protein